MYRMQNGSNFWRFLAIVAIVLTTASTFNCGKDSTGPEESTRIGVQAQVDLSGDTRLPYPGIHITTPTQNIETAPDQSAEILLNRGNYQLVMATVEDTVPVLMGIAPPPTAATRVILSERSTAVSLVYLTPYICQRDTGSARVVLEWIETLTEISQLEQAIHTELLSDSRYLFAGDREIVELVTDAREKVLTRILDNVGPDRAPGAASVITPPGEQDGVTVTEIPGASSVERFMVQNTRHRWLQVVVPAGSTRHLPSAGGITDLFGSRTWAIDFDYDVESQASAAVRAYGPGFTNAGSMWSGFSLTEKSYVINASALTFLADGIGPVLGTILGVGEIPNQFLINLAQCAAADAGYLADLSANLEGIVNGENKWGNIALGTLNVVVNCFIRHPNLVGDILAYFGQSALSIVINSVAAPLKIIRMGINIINWTVVLRDVIISRPMVEFTITAEGDQIPPAAITDLSATNPTATSVTLIWTAPGDDGSTGTATQYDVRYSTSAISESAWGSATQVAGEPSPKSAGSGEFLAVTGLNVNTTYYFASKTGDEAANWSGLSNVASGRTSGASDQTSPAAITDLVAASGGPTAVALGWTAPGDDGTEGTAVQYDIRFSMSAITESNWNAATRVTPLPNPRPSGTWENVPVSGLSSGTTYYFAIKSADEVPNWSALSNLASASTVGTGDVTSPAPIADLVASAPRATSVMLTWTAPGDDGATGIASTYDIRYSTNLITPSTWDAATQVAGIPLPKPSGNPESFVLGGLSPSTTYYFAIKTADEVLNWSPLSNAASATTGSGSWSLLGSGMNDLVESFAIYNERLVAGGWFTSAGGIPASGVAAWNGATWSPLGSGLHGKVDALTIYNGQLIAGGTFTFSGGVLVNNIAAWNGNSWSPVGTGIDGGVLCLAVYNGQLIAAGGFTSAGGVAANNVAAWNGSAWSPLGSGVGVLGGNDVVEDLTVYNGQLVAGGAFGVAGGVGVGNIATWNGISWSSIGGVSGQVLTFSVYNGQLIVGGLFASPGGVSSTNIAAWNGTSWSSLSWGMDSYVLALSVYRDQLIAGGAFLFSGGIPFRHVAAWNGSSWSSLGSGRDGYIFALTAYDGRLVASEGRAVVAWSE